MGYVRTVRALNSLVARVRPVLESVSPFFEKAEYAAMADESFRDNFGGANESGETEEWWASVNTA